MASKPSKLGNIAKDKGSRRMLGVLALVVIGGGAYAMFFSGSEQQSGPPSKSVGAPTSLNTTQGQQSVDQEYGGALDKADNQRIEEAKKDGGSALPTIRKEDVQETISLPDEQPEEPAEKPEEQEEPKIVEDDGGAPEQGKPDISSPTGNSQQGVARPQLDEEILQAMRGQVQSLMDARRPSPARVQYHSDPEQDGEPEENESQPATGETQAAATGTPDASTASAESGEESEPAVPLPSPGTILYAEVVNRANSDTPGPVVARVLQGKLRGAKVIGSFSTAEDKLIIKFDTLSMPALDKPVSINATAIDTADLEPGVATDVDRHLWSKLSVAFVASFIEGFSQAITESGKTVVTNGTGDVVAESTPELDTTEQVWKGVGAAAESGNEILTEEFGNRPTTITVDPGTRIGLLFVR